MTITGSILVFEYSPALALTYCDQLRQSGFTATAAEDQSTARALVREQTYDVMLLDLAHGSLGGLEFLRECASSPQTLPTIALTAHGTSNLAADAMKAGACDYLMKPFDARRLVTTVTNVLANSKPKSPAFPANVSNARKLRECIGSMQAFDPQAVRQAGGIQPLRLIEQVAIQDALVSTGGNIQKAARLLEISPSTIYRKMDEWKLERATA